MKGIQYVFDERGEVSAVLIDVKKHRKLWEDIQDILVARERRQEPFVPLADVKRKLREKGKLS